MASRWRLSSFLTNPCPFTKAAAEQLQYHVRRASGAELSILPESQAKTSTGNVYLGACRRTLALGLWPRQTKPNGFVIRVAEDDLFICGDDSNGVVFGMQHTNRTRVGTLFGVYELLERDLKVRWLWPGELGTDVPRSRDIAIANWNVVGAPPLIHSRWVDCHADLAPQVLLLLVLQLGPHFNVAAQLGQQIVNVERLVQTVRFPPSPCPPPRSNEYSTQQATKNQGEQSVAPSTSPAGAVRPPSVMPMRPQGTPF